LLGAGINLRLLRGRESGATKESQNSGKSQFHRFFSRVIVAPRKSLSNESRRANMEAPRFVRNYFGGDVGAGVAEGAPEFRLELMKGFR